MNNKPTGPQVEWVSIPARRIYVALGLLAALMVIGAGVYLWFHSRQHTPVAADPRSVTGALTSTFEGAVRVVRGDTREIIMADAGTRLYPGDTLQTEATGRASVVLADGSTLLVRPNSVITISENAGAIGGSAAHVRVAIEGGQVKVSTVRQAPETSNIVETPLAGNRLSTQTAASFDVHADKSEEVRVSAGLVERHAGGSQAALRAGEYVAFDRLGEVKRREQLLDTPVPYAPPDRTNIPTQTGSEQVVLQWTHPLATTAVTYRVEIAASPFFVKPGIVFARDRLRAPQLTATELKPGSYFWRVQAESPGEQVSEWCEPQKFIIVPARQNDRSGRGQD